MCSTHRERATNKEARRVPGPGHTLTVAAVLLVTAVLAVLVAIAAESAGDALAASALHQPLAETG